MNINNIIAGFLGFLVAIGLLWLIWTPATTIIGYLPSELSIIANIAFVGIIFLACVMLPMAFLTTDDTGKA